MTCFKRVKVQFCIFVSFGLTFISLFYGSEVKAQGDLFINPKRIVFDGHKRSEDITLANIGNDTARYLISFVQIKLKDNGDFEQIEKPDSGQYFADKNLRIFPRTITLGPKENQIIKVQLYQQEKLTKGEYRSHLYFRGVPRVKPLGEKDENKGAQTVTVNITPVFGISIPVIIRIGASDTQLSISDLKFSNRDHPILQLRLNRTGNMSIYGDVEIVHVSVSGVTTKVGALRGVAVYTPNLFRNINIDLNVDKKVNYASGKLQISYLSTNNGRTEKLASAEIGL